MSESNSSGADGEFLYNLSLADKLYKANYINEAKDVFVAAIKLFCSRHQLKVANLSPNISLAEANGVITAISTLADIHLLRSNDATAAESNEEIVSLVVSLFPPKFKGSGILIFDYPDIENNIAIECATILINESDWRRDQGDYRRARILIMLAHEICSHNLAPDHPVFAECLSCEASIMLSEGHYGEALQLAGAGLVARAKHYPDNHLAIAASQYMKARALVYLGRYDEASKLLVTAAAIRRAQLGQKHPAVAQCVHCHALIRELMGYPQEALEELKVALDMRVECGNKLKGYRDITESIFSLAVNAEVRGAFVKAQQLFERALKLTLEHLSTKGNIESIDAAEVLIGLGNLYRVIGRYTDAASVLGKAGIMLCRLYGEQHLKLSDCLLALAELSKAMGQYRDAKVLFGRCVTLRRGKLDATHPAIATVLHGTAENLWLMGHYSEASELGDSALIARVGIFGEDHPDVASSLLLRGCILRDIGEVPSALTILNRVLDLARNRLGADHPMVATTLREIGECQRIIGRYDDAEHALAEALRLRKALFVEAFEGSEGDDELRTTATVQTGLAEVGDCLSCLGRLYIVSGKVPVAKLLFKDAVVPMLTQCFCTEAVSVGTFSAGAVERNDDDHPQLIMAKGCLGLILSIDSNAQEAEEGKKAVHDALVQFRTHRQAHFSATHQWVKFLGGYPRDILEMPDAEELEEMAREANERATSAREKNQNDEAEHRERELQVMLANERNSFEREDLLSKQRRVDEKERLILEREAFLHAQAEELERRRVAEEKALAQRVQELEEKRLQDEAALRAREEELSKEEQRRREEANALLLCAAIEVEKHRMAELLDKESRRLIYDLAGFESKKILKEQQEAAERRERELQVMLANERNSFEREDLLSKQRRVDEKERLMLEREAFLQAQAEELERRRTTEEKALTHRAQELEEKRLQDEAALRARQEEAEKIFIRAAIESEKRRMGDFLEQESKALIRHLAGVTLSSEEENLMKKKQEQEAELARLRQEHEAELFRLKQEQEKELARQVMESVRMLREEDAEVVRRQLEIEKEMSLESRERWQMQVEDDSEHLRRKLSRVAVSTREALAQEEEQARKKLDEELKKAQQLHESWLAEHEAAVANMRGNLQQQALLMQEKAEEVEKAEELKEALLKEAELARSLFRRQTEQAWEAHEGRLMQLEDDTTHISRRLSKETSLVKTRVIKEVEMARSKLERQLEIARQANERRIMQCEDDSQHILLKIQQDAEILRNQLGRQAEYAREQFERQADHARERKELINMIAEDESCKLRRMLEAEAEVQRDRAKREAEAILASQRELAERNSMFDEEMAEKRRLRHEKEALERLRVAQETEEMRKLREEEERKLQALSEDTTRKEMQAEEIYERKRLAEERAIIEENIRQEEIQNMMKEEKWRREEDERLRKEEEARLVELERIRREEEERCRKQEEETMTLEEAHQRAVQAAIEEAERLQREEEERLRLEALRYEEEEREAEESYLMESEDIHSAACRQAILTEELARKQAQQESDELAAMLNEDQRSVWCRAHAIELAQLEKEIAARAAEQEEVERELMSTEEKQMHSFLQVEAAEKARKLQEKLLAEEREREAKELESMASEESSGEMNRQLTELDARRAQEEAVRLQLEEERILRERLEQDRQRIADEQAKKAENDKERRAARAKLREEEELHQSQLREQFEKELQNTLRKGKAPGFSFAAVCAGLRSETDSPDRSAAVVRESPFSSPLKLPAGKFESTIANVSHSPDSPIANPTNFDIIDDADFAVTSSGKIVPITAFESPRASSSEDPAYNASRVGSALKDSDFTTPEKNVKTRSLNFNAPDSTDLLPGDVASQRSFLMTAPAAMGVDEASLFDMKSNSRVILGGGAHRNPLSLTTSSSVVLVESDDDLEAGSSDGMRWATKMPIGSTGKKGAFSTKAVVNFDVLDGNFIDQHFRWAKPGKAGTSSRLTGRPATEVVDD